MTDDGLRVTAALAWWNERPEDLANCVRAVANIADRIVAFDGAYERYPGATISSSIDQFDAIRETADVVGLDWYAYQPDRLWLGQVEKRTALLQEAVTDADWVVIIDADHLIRTDRGQARRALAEMPATVNTVGAEFYTPIDRSREFWSTIATNWQANMAGTSVRMTHIIRALPGIRVKDRHWIYVAPYKGRQISLEYGGKPDRMIGVPYLVEHRSLFRSEEQLRAGRAFCNDRERVLALTGQEDHVPGLPPPRFNFSKIPYQSIGRPGGNAPIQPPSDEPEFTPEELRERRKAAQLWVWSPEQPRRPRVR